MIEGAVAGVLSAMLISMGGSDRELTEKLKAAKMWMREQKIPHAGKPNTVENARLEGSGQLSAGWVRRGDAGAAAAAALAQV